MSKVLKISGAIIAALVVISIAASFYFFHVAQVRAEKDFIDNSPTKKTSAIYQDEQDFKTLTKETWHMTNEKLKLQAWYVPAAKATDHTVIVVHGFNGSKDKMTEYAYMFHQLGYNVLMPDNRAHGKSEGTLIGFGATDKRDVEAWITKLNDKMPNQKITLFGLSMGAATVMMASGDDLPDNVMNIIEDCGYSSVWEELVFQAKDMYNLPAFPILYEVSMMSKIRAGWDYKSASSVDALKKNKLPVLFIHGDKDDFVPTEMVYEVYDATQGPKELWLTKGAKHAESLEKHKTEYYAKVKAFMTKYAG